MSSSITNALPRTISADVGTATPSVTSAAASGPRTLGFGSVDRFERTRGQPDTGKTDQYKSMKSILDTGVKAGDDPLVDHEVEKLIHTDQKPATKTEQEARDTFLKAAQKAGYDISQAPNKSNR
ncbi:MAG: hypothetical protein U1E65_21525 [Myxococcota bacterium]